MINVKHILHHSINTIIEYTLIAFIENCFGFKKYYYNIMYFYFLYRILNTRLTDTRILNTYVCRLKLHMFMYIFYKSFDCTHFNTVSIKTPTFVLLNTHEIETPSSNSKTGQPWYNLDWLSFQPLL